MSNQHNTTELEFLLTLNNNIICQRYFPVRNYNSKNVNSLDVKDYISNICNEISEDLKRKTFLYLTDMQKSGNLDENEEINTDEQYYSLELKLDNQTFIKRSFLSNVYHPKVRYSVDIRPKLKKYLDDLSNIFSKKNVETKYLNHKL